MQSLIYVPDGGSLNKTNSYVELALKESYILSTVQNVGAVEHTLITEDIPGVDGTHIVNERIEAREIPCTVYVHGANRQNMYYLRSELIHKLSGKTEGWLYYQNDYVNVRIRAKPILPGNFTERIAEYNKCDIKFYCADPAWQEVEPSNIEIGYTTGVGLSFPTEFNAITFGTREMRRTVECLSSTDKTPVKITITGQAEHPKITNVTTGETMAFENLSMALGDELVIDTTPGDLSVRLTTGSTTKSAFNLISPTSIMWQLIPGSNTISYSADDAAQNINIKIEWVTRHEGV